MGNYNKKNRSGGGGREFGSSSSRDGRGGNRGYGDRKDRERPQMHKATCAKCEKACEVPFRPTGDKPVYCSDCFSNKGGRSGERNSGGGRTGGRDFKSGRDRSQMHKATCAKCEKACEVPFRPTGDKPIYCSDCFENQNGGNAHSSYNQGRKSSGPRNTRQNLGGDHQPHADLSKNIERLHTQFQNLNTKLDTILGLLTPAKIKSEKKSETQASKQAKKLANKEIDIAALKKVVRKATSKKPVIKKTTTKKAATKKSASKKK